MEENPTIISFRVIYMIQRPSRKKQPISEFHHFETTRLPNEFYNIRMIIFYFNTFYVKYPYSIHPIILKRIDNRFEVLFYQYYTSKNLLVELHLHQQIYDYNALCLFLKNSVLLPLINMPNLNP